ncbi:MAG: helix-turn-helix domain-containing protein [Erysipelotrichaceae bacterium]|nr:helix-turn-helix domain-containing protein [Erysipelotrichaceae bacterium]
MNSKQIIERNKVLEKHALLQEEYNRLCNNKKLMTQDEWEKLESRKKSLLLEIDNCKAQEKLYDEQIQSEFPNNFNLQMLKSEEVMQLLNCSYPTLKAYVEIGMLKPIKTGKNFMFVQDDIYQFEQTYKGKDISNYKKALLVYNELIEKEPS